MFFLSGVARFLFVPLAEAVVFAMLASYGLSRTLVPTLAKYLLRLQHHGPTRNPFVLLQRAFEHGFERLRDGYQAILAVLVLRRLIFVPLFLSACLSRVSALSVAGPGFLPGFAIPASSSCTCAPRPERESKRPRACAIWWSSPSVARFRATSC